MLSEIDYLRKTFFLVLRKIVKRDVAERGFDVSGVLKLYQRFVKPSYDTYVYPTKKSADVVSVNQSYMQASFEMLEMICLGKEKKEAQANTK